MLNEIAYAGAVEQLMGLEPPRRAQYICLLVGELQRIASHQVSIGTYINDLGTTTPLLWTFRDRGGIMDLFEALASSRFNVNYIRVGGVLHDFPGGWLSACEAYLDQLEQHMGELETLINGNEYPWRAKPRGPPFVNLQVLPEPLRGYKMSDVLAVLGAWISWSGKWTANTDWCKGKPERKHCRCPQWAW